MQVVHLCRYKQVILLHNIKAQHRFLVMLVSLLLEPQNHLLIMGRMILPNHTQAHVVLMKLPFGQIKKLLKPLMEPTQVQRVQ